MTMSRLTAPFSHRIAAAFGVLALLFSLTLGSAQAVQVERVV